MITRKALEILENMLGFSKHVNRAYDAVRDPNAYRPSDFRRSIGAAASAVRALR
jgi:hypothetical protein